MEGKPAFRHAPQQAYGIVIEQIRRVAQTPGQTLG